uniref:Uncharacterized protein n=1 Tax=Lepeophtheirus salmonis TaxID=72036 RepID=A0A0K2V520_LEPSM
MLIAFKKERFLSKFVSKNIFERFLKMNILLLTFLRWKEQSEISCNRIEMFNK